MIHRGEGGDLDSLEVHNILFMEGDGWSLNNNNALNRCSVVIGV